MGKTSILTNFISGNFEESVMTTTGASFATKTMYVPKYDKSFKFEIWDTAGQERYRSLAKIFFKDANAAIMVYDITRKASFEGLRSYWVKSLQESTSKHIVLAVCGNKSDLFEQEEVDEEDAKSFAAGLNSIFKLASARNDSGIDDLFMAIANRLCDPSHKEAIDNDPNELNKANDRKETITIQKNAKLNGSKEKNKKKWC